MGMFFTSVPSAFEEGFVAKTGPCERVLASPGPYNLPPAPNKGAVLKDKEYSLYAQMLTPVKRFWGLKSCMLYRGQKWGGSVRRTDLPGSGDQHGEDELFFYLTPSIGSVWQVLFRYIKDFRGIRSTVENFTVS